MTRAERIEAAARALLRHPLAYEAPTRAAFDPLRDALSEEEGTPAAKVGPGFCSIRSDAPSPATPGEDQKCPACEWLGPKGNCPKHGTRRATPSEDAPVCPTCEGAPSYGRLTCHRCGGSGRATPRGDR